jgi:Uma2 family endonuclease
MATHHRHDDSERSRWPRKGRHMTEEEYHELERISPERKYEYLAGVAYLMSGGSVAHDRINRNVSAALDRYLSGECTAFGVDVQVLVGIKRNGKPHFVYPDATVSCNVADRRPDNTLIESPRVVIEVLSPGTEAKDRGVKFNVYQHCPLIQEIVLISQFSQHIEVWQRNEQDRDNPKAWLCWHYGPGEVVHLKSINVQIEIGELYRGLVFDEGEEEI